MFHLNLKPKLFFVSFGGEVEREMSLFCFLVSRWLKRGRRNWGRFNNFSVDSMPNPTNFLCIWSIFWSRKVRVILFRCVIVRCGEGWRWAKDHIPMSLILCFLIKRSVLQSWDGWLSWGCLIFGQILLDDDWFFFPFYSHFRIISIIIMENGDNCQTDGSDL
jgi:hypothetical protein